jgi:hypothetical protein
MNPAPQSRAGFAMAARPVAAVVSLAALIFLLHGRCLDYGLFMDDYAHFRQLRACDWSLRGLTDACRLELVGGVIELWWLPETTLRFFRPVAFGLMKLAYTLVGWNPAAMHTVSLAWHLAACVLLMILLGRLGAARWLAWAVTALFAIHPGHVATVQWIACQTELMVTTFLLAGTLCFGRFRGWPGFGHGLASSPGGARWAIASVLFFMLALGCRENAIMFPLVVAAVEFVVWRRRKRSALALYGVLLVIAAAFLALRAASLGGAGIPPRPYVVSPTDPDFFRFIADKSLYTLLGEFLLIPSVPIGGLAYFQARPVLFYGLAVVPLALLVVACIRARHRPLEWLGPAWLVGFMLPILPVFPSPHHLYLPGVGWAIVALVLLRDISLAAPQAVRWRRRLRLAAGVGATALTAAVFAVVTYYFSLVFATGQAVEDCVAEEVVAAPGGLHDGDVLYMANLPVVAHYTKLAVEQRTGRHGLRVLPLTWSPRLLGAATPSELHWADQRTLDVRVVQDRYFDGPLGLLVREATGRDIPDEVDCRARLGFRVRVLERDTAGIVALRFEFDTPPLEDGRHLFWGSRARWACEVRP